jgi:hypothetical protein
MRGVNRAAAALFGLALIGLGLLVVLETGLVAAGRAALWFPLDRWHATLTRTSLVSRGFLVAAIVVGVIGVLILVAELWPRRPDRLIAAHGPWWLRRRSVERRTATMAAAVPGIDHARAHARGRPGRWRLVLAADGASDKTDVVNRAVRDEMRRLDIDDRTEVRVALHKPARRVE